jgi:hypothetical protein
LSLSRLLPPKGLPRAIAFQSAVIAIGGGTFLTGSVVFFTHVLGLSPVQIGVGLSIAGSTSLATSLHWADWLTVGWPASLGHRGDRGGAGFGLPIAGLVRRSSHS